MMVFAAEKVQGPEIDWLAISPLIALVAGACIVLLTGLLRAPFVRLADRYSLVFLPVTLVLAGAAWLSARFLTGRSRLHRLERWQTTYLPVFVLWAATVVVVLPLVFTFS